MASAVLLSSLSNSRPRVLLLDLEQPLVGSAALLSPDAGGERTRPPNFGALAHKMLDQADRRGSVAFARPGRGRALGRADESCPPEKVPAKNGPSVAIRALAGTAGRKTFARGAPARSGV